VHIFPYGITRDRLEKAAERMQVPIRLVKDLGQADLLFTTKRFYRKRPKVIKDAEQRNLPIYVLRANTISQMESCLSDVFDLETEAKSSLERALREAEEAIQQVLEGASEVELEPQNAYVRRRQHELARSADLTSKSLGQEPDRRVRIFRK
jgi:hypothetical protein